MKTTIDGNTAAAHVAYAFSEVAAIYPITPASPIGETVDEWAAKGKENIFGQKVKVIEMQSEAGAAGVVHGSLSAGALTTTFTASQGLLLMLPNMFKIAGEMQPTVFHIAARSLAYQSLSIFGDHSDVMAARGTGFVMLASSSVQEVMDNAIVSHLSTLEARIPFLHFFDGFRTSHEIQKIELVDYEVIKSMIEMKYITSFRKRALSPDRPVAKVGAQNPDVYFQGREVSNKFYDDIPRIVKKYYELLGKKTGRKYKLYEYVGAKDAKKIIISMGSSCETIEETVRYLNKKGEKVGALKVRLYRPFAIKDFTSIIPKTVKKIAVLDRTKESGSIGEPLYQDVVSALKDSKNITIIGGRYGLSSKEFTPSMVKAVFDHLDSKCFTGFTVGINDDVTHKSIPINGELEITPKSLMGCKFWGFGSDGTVGANKNSIKILGEETDMYVQAYFSYDSKKSGGTTISHLRFGKHEIKAPYLLTTVDFVALHNHSFIGKYDILEGIKEGGTFLLNSPWEPDEVFGRLTKEMQETIIQKKIKFYNIDAYSIAREVGLGRRINTVMQAAFFKISKVLPEKKSMELMKKFVKKTFEKKGMDIVKMNWTAIDKAGDALVRIKIPEKTTTYKEHRIISDHSIFADRIIQPIMDFKGDNIPVSHMTLDGSIPTGTAKLEKRGIAIDVPKWLPEHCIQCGFCSFVCPHSAIRMKQIKPEKLVGASKSFKTIKSNTKNDKELQFKVQVFPEDCTGCTLCIDICPTKEKSLVMTDIDEERRLGENENVTLFESLPDNIVDGVPENTLKWTQLREPLFEFSGACSGCGETPYIKLLTQLFGERMIIANATGCSSIFGGTFPTIPYTKNKEGKGPAWANSLFEDNAEYGFGMRIAVDANREQLLSNIKKILVVGTTPKLVGLLNHIVYKWNDVSDAAQILAKEIRAELLNALKQSTGKQKEIIEKIIELEDYFVDRTVWAIGGDGWAYDIGFGGLDHVLAQGKKINVLVLDTEVYSNTGGQASKSTPIGAVAKFAAAGKEIAKKNLGLMMMSYKYIYIASVNLGANRNQLIKAMVEAEKYDGPSIIIAYSPCINHGIDLSKSGQIERNAVNSGYWPLYRYNPDLIREGKNPFVWDSPEVTIPLSEYMKDEKRYTILKNEFPERAERLYKLAEEEATKRFAEFKKMSE
ncbi:MAG: pyruvate:ferredoxin (flavodoxin) oxidoreductase [Nanoarchaeota archaeon]|nr:pyruvate:ferredoxin (flavodoxin) oxidoreductase [Nanoarchaeota archaeon]MBU1269962.1 pyruvate:ferredoxin (flavodoxin) oxidoreductase [Nanoarchaeota archaeon]MBU1603802.1 pyruvate:ferredoxin (flavodoxin) oxidoreductase [Nanoarchaeota archaeon]MBU2443183.1 pyruvate:ferredoxin (flavodoxin) oxidoreductase [Nanoarchaeota archaeon]